MYIKTAFLNGVLEEEIYLEPPSLTESLWDKYNYQFWKEQAWKLMKSIYGLKQAPRILYRSIRKNVLEIGFKLAAADPCLFSWKHENECIFLFVDVDDI